MWPVTLAAPLMGLMWVTQAETRSSAIAKRAQADQAFVHPGALHTSKDFARIKRHLEAGEEPWATAWQHLQSNDLAQTSWEPSPHELLVRGEIDGHDQTFEDAYRDAHSAYQLAVRWQLSGDDTYAEHAASILDAWSSTLKDITGNPDMYLAAGLYGYQFANAAELLREYGGWSDERQHIFADMLVNIFAHYNRLFLDEHNGQPDFYYANWDLCNIASLMAIGIYADNATLFDFALEYFLHGPADGAVANGALPFFGIANFTEENTGKTLTQNQDAGRDQAHALMCFGLLATIAQQGYNQGVDLYEAWGDQILNAYVPRDVPNPIKIPSFLVIRPHIFFLTNPCSSTALSMPRSTM